MMNKAEELNIPVLYNTKANADHIYDNGAVCGVQVTEAKVQKAIIVLLQQKRNCFVIQKEHTGTEDIYEAGVAAKATVTSNAIIAAVSDIMDQAA